MAGRAFWSTEKDRVVPSERARPLQVRHAAVLARQQVVPSVE